jgi:hypothetical protein
MLKKGKNGNEILTILDAITNNPVESVMETVTAVGDAITNNPTAVGNRNYNSSW